MPSPSSQSDEHRDDNNGNNHHAIISLKSEVIILLSLLSGFTILAIRPFGFRSFLAGVAHGEIYPLFILFGIIAVIIVLLQRLGIIYVERSADRYAQ